MTQDDLIRDLVLARAAMIERACEQAIQGGTCGVRVRNHPGGAVTATADPLVPYGYVFEHEAMVLP